MVFIFYINSLFTKTQHSHNLRNFPLKFNCPFLKPSSLPQGLPLTPLHIISKRLTRTSSSKDICHSHIVIAHSQAKDGIVIIPGGKVRKYDLKGH